MVIDLSISPEKEDEGTGAQKEVIPVTPVTPATPAVVPTGEVDTPKSIPVTNAKEQDNKASDDLNKTVSPGKMVIMFSLFNYFYQRALVVFKFEFFV